MLPIPEEREFTTIQVKKGTRERLKKLGRKGETYNDIITKLLKEYEERGNEP